MGFLESVKKIFSHMDFTLNDAESLLSNVVLISTLCLAFVITVWTGTMRHEELKAADERYLRFHFDGKGKKGSRDDTEMPLVSEMIMSHGSASVMCFCLSNLIGVGVFWSMSMGSAREDPVWFSGWWRIFGRCVHLAYGLMAVGVFFFYMLNQDIYTAIAPYYPGNKPSSVLEGASLANQELYILFTRYNGTIPEISMVPELGLDADAYLQSKSMKIAEWTLALMVAMVVALGFSHVVNRHFLAKKEKNPPTPSTTVTDDALRVEELLFVTGLEKHRECLKAARLDGVPLSFFERSDLLALGLPLGDTMQLWNGLENLREPRESRRRSGPWKAPLKETE